MKHHHLTITALLIAVISARLIGSVPSWWTNPDTRIFETGDDTGDNYAPANVGQLKHVASQAKAYLDRSLNLSPAFWDLAYADHVGGPFPFEPESGDFAPVNVGQLKYVASGFYEMLNHLEGFSVSNFLDAQGVSAENRTSGNTVFPWADGVSPSEYYAPINLGQLKLVFSFSLEGSSSTQLNTDWLLSYFSVTGTNPSVDPDCDDLSNQEEFWLKSDTEDFTTRVSGIGTLLLLVF